MKWKTIYIFVTKCTSRAKVNLNRIQCVWWLLFKIIFLIYLKLFIALILILAKFTDVRTCVLHYAEGHLYAKQLFLMNEYQPCGSDKFTPLL